MTMKTETRANGRGASPWAAIGVTVLFAALICGILPAERTDQFKGAGIRSSTYGRPDDPGPGYWARTGTEIAAKFPGAKPEAIWIVSRLKGRGTEMSFPVPPGTDPLITGMSEDISEPVLKLFDELGYRVWLQTEPGWAPIEEVFHVILERYGHHKCVVGVGVDVEWHRSNNPDAGDPVTDEMAEAWLAEARSHDPSYRMFLKHFRQDVMPPAARDGILFVDDSQIFDSANAMIAEFAEWGKSFAPAPVGFQYGYRTDKPWWGPMKDPVKEIGDRILAAVPNTEMLIWVDFSIQDVFPPDPAKGDRVKTIVKNP
ncbi:MAG TPA: hypothetical protein PK207_10015 [Candidatus Aminicenantes bacterium]|nr:hypothetical protein [Candidatus Aminicenantes bacterium]HOU48562.1 hypothetical protein [Candidatus Aminicenantes bacterium]HPL14528.1 hypothetical protein [Candidatus Aminicenantes bacterium]HQF96899.1 hypothetical protein [Candidatus Aminicenantes bacterium]HQH44611.1 hypothetical protein [Candidatus Aminicenantes bacterium]